MSSIQVLYVEDEPFLAKIVQESLESRGYQVRLVTDGTRVMEAFEDRRPDICILDVMLPNQDGFSLGELIRERDARMPIIFLTAKSRTEDVLKGFESGGNDYLKKPFSMEELIIRIQNLLQLVHGQESLAAEGVIEIGKYHFAPQKLELCLGDTVRKLSHRENQLLEILVKHRNLKVERRDILKEVWGDDSFYNSRNLDVYIKKLRDYFREDPGVEIITLKGVGYRFVVS